MAFRKNFVLKGNICCSRDPHTFETFENAYLVCVEGHSQGIYEDLPDKYRNLPLADYGDFIIVPGLVDLHVHAPQFAFRGLGMDLELLEWLDARVFPEEAKYDNASYAMKAYGMFVEDIRKGPNTRVSVFATRHVPATEMLMEMLEESGLVSFVGKVNMDRNCPADVREESCERSAADTVDWIERCAGKYENTFPILTPRFIPACSDRLMERLKKIQREYGLPVQSHLSENPDEVKWVRELCPSARSYGDAYLRFGLFGGDVPTIMAHCVYSGDGETELMKERGVFVAHCPQSNTNLSSGIAPVRRFLEKGLKMGLGSDVAGGSDTSIFRIMRDAVQVSKLRWRLINQEEKPLTPEEAFFMGTAGGGAFFGKVGSFATGYEFDALVIDDENLSAPFGLSIPERVARIVMFSDERNIRAKYVRGKCILGKEPEPRTGFSA